MRRARLERGWTLRDLDSQCRQAGARIGFSQLSKIERGMVTPRPKARAVLAKLLGLDIDDFDATLDDTDEALTAINGGIGDEGGLAEADLETAARRKS